MFAQHARIARRQTIGLSLCLAGLFTALALMSSAQAGCISSLTGEPKCHHSFIVAQDGLIADRQLSQWYKDAFAGKDPYALPFYFGQCYSGGFVNDLAGPDGLQGKDIIIGTSADWGRPAHYFPGCVFPRCHNDFTQEFDDELPTANDFCAAWDQARQDWVLSPLDGPQYYSSPEPLGENYMICDAPDQHYAILFTGKAARPIEKVIFDMETDHVYDHLVRHCQIPPENIKVLHLDGTLTYGTAPVDGPATVKNFHDAVKEFGGKMDGADDSVFTWVFDHGTDRLCCGRKANARFDKELHIRDDQFEFDGEDEGIVVIKEWSHALAKACLPPVPDEDWDPDPDPPPGPPEPEVVFKWDKTQGVLTSPHEVQTAHASQWCPGCFAEASVVATTTWEPVTGGVDVDQHVNLFASTQRLDPVPLSICWALAEHKETIHATAWKPGEILDLDLWVELSSELTIDGNPEEVSRFTWTATSDISGLEDMWDLTVEATDQLFVSFWSNPNLGIDDAAVESFLNDKLQRVDCLIWLEDSLGPPLFDPHLQIGQSEWEITSYMTAYAKIICVPEPTTVLLLGGALLFLRRRRKR